MNNSTFLLNLLFIIYIIPYYSCKSITKGFYWLLLIIFPSPHYLWVEIAMNKAGYREIIGAAGDMKAGKASWGGFFQLLRGHGLDEVKLIVSYNVILPRSFTRMRVFLKRHTSCSAY